LSAAPIVPPKGGVVQVLRDRAARQRVARTVKDRWSNRLNVGNGNRGSDT